MKKLYKMIILLGFLIVIIGGIIYVGGQLVCFFIGQPEAMVAIDENISGILFPVASISGLLCYVYGYIWHDKKQKSED